LYGRRLSARTGKSIHGAVVRRYNAVVNRVLALAVALTLASGRGFGEELRFRGTVKRGERFFHRLNHDLAFGLAPTEWRTANCDGWHLWIGPSREENFADLATGPLHRFSALSAQRTLGIVIGL
jgi:hypothetical protein